MAKHPKTNGGNGGYSRKKAVTCNCAPPKTQAQRRTTTLSKAGAEKRRR